MESLLAHAAASNSRSAFFNSPIPRDNSRSNLSAMKESGVKSPVPVRYEISDAPPTVSQARHSWFVFLLLFADYNIYQPQRDMSMGSIHALTVFSARRRAEKFKPKLPVAGDFRVRVLIVDEAFGVDTAGRRAVQVWPNPEYRTRQKVGGTLRYILYQKLRYKCRPFFPRAVLQYILVVTEIK
jgi:hypothetical protein